MDEAIPSTPPKRKRNWWKLAFFVALIAFEGARELFVIANATEAVPNVSPMVFNYGDEGSIYVRAEGSWVRTDDGGGLQPTVVSIECRQEKRECVEVFTNMSKQYVFAPDVSFYEATFEKDSVTYQNDFPTCARYQVRIDYKLKQVIAVRERKSNKGDCAILEPRIEMSLGRPATGDPAKGHFVPLLQLLIGVLSLF